MDDLRTMMQRADHAAARIPLPGDGLERLIRVRVRRRRNQRITAAVVGLAIGLAAVLTGTTILRSSPRPAPGVTPLPISAPPSAIAFGRVTVGEGSSVAEQVFLELPDGSTMPLTHGPDSNELESWSPDGSQIVVSTTFADGSGSDLFIEAVDGTSGTRLTTDPRAETDAQWSPDGSRIAFRNGRGISVINADGTDVHELTSQTNDLPETFSWSPDGARIAFISTERDGSEIDVADADGTDRSVLRRANAPTTYIQLAWSPDGSKIALVEGSGHSTEIDLMDADGSNVRRFSSIQAGRPAWSPDGSKISIEGNGGVYVIDVHDGTVHHVSGSGSGTASWSPDGSMLAIFDAGDIVVMRADGTNGIRIVDTTSRETSPLWWPGG
jgi:Tol biopolymer transport system component